MEDWRLERYRLHARLDAHKRRVERARKIIEDALARHSAWYVAWSGGKDSNALLHLVRTIEPEIPVVHVDTPLDYPDCRLAVRRWIEEWNLNCVVVRPDVSPWDIMDKHGGPEGQVNEARSELDRLCFFEPIRKVTEERGFCGVFMGLRAEESRARLLNRAVRGTLYTLKSGITHCNPLSDWTAADVWGYTVANDLPWLPVYDKTRGHPEPERIREGWFVPGGHSSSRGGLLWLKLNYPECYEAIRKRYPEYAAQT